MPTAGDRLPQPGRGTELERLPRQLQRGRPRSEAGQLRDAQLAPPQRQDDADDLRGLGERAGLRLLEQDAAGRNPVVVARPALLLLELQPAPRTIRNASSRGLPARSGTVDRAADDRPAEAEPHGSARKMAASRAPYRTRKRTLATRAKLTRDGSLGAERGRGPRNASRSRVPGTVPSLPRADAEVETPDWFSDPRFKKADLHCHSVYSTFKYFRIANTRDSYNRPEEVYRLAKERGMDFVTITDHDSIDGCLASARTAGRI